jgi:hypothetical protein
VALDRERTIPTELPPLFGEVSVNFLRISPVAAVDIKYIEWLAARSSVVLRACFPEGRGGRWDVLYRKCDGPECLL